jgi:phytoene synthase
MVDGCERAGPVSAFRAAVGTLEATPPVRYCEGVTRRRARNFWYGIRLLPRPKRRALAAIYAMARRIDDVGDGDRPPKEKREALERIETSLDHIESGSPDPVLAALGQAASAFPIPVAAFRDLLDGVFGSNGSSRANSLADDLGVAMQLTNILRDVREDLGRGRVYVPTEDLERFGCLATDLAGPASPAILALIRFEAARAREWFGRGLRLLPILDRRSAACAGTMALIYERLMSRIDARPQEVLWRRVSLTPWEKGWAAMQALIGAAR